MSRFLVPVSLILSGWLSCAFGQQPQEVQHFAGSPGGPGTSDGIGSEAWFQFPNAIWGDGTYLYVSDQGGRAIRRVDLASKEVVLLAGSLSAAGVVDSVGTAARFSGIRALWGDGVYLYIADSARIRRMTIATTQVITIAGSTSGAPVDGPTASAVFRGATSIWGTGQYLFVVDNGSILPSITNGTLRRLDLAASTVTTIALPIATPDAVTGDSQHLFIGDPYRVYSMDLGTGAFQLVANIPTIFQGFNPLQSAADGFIYSAAIDSATILRINPSTHEVVPIFGTANQPDWIDGIGTQSRFRNPQGMWSYNSQLYIADSQNHAVRSADLNSLQVTTLAGVGVRIAIQLPDQPTPAGVSWSDGTYFYFGAGRDQVWRMPVGGGPAAIFSNGQFSSIIGMWGDGTFLYVDDQSGNRIQKVSLSTGNVSTLVDVSNQFPYFKTIPSNNIWGDGTSIYVAGNTAIFKIDATTGAMQLAAGIPDVGGAEDGLPPRATFNGAAGIWGDGTYLYIADNTNRLIRRMTLATNEVATLAGQPISTGPPIDGIGSQARFGSPASVWGDGSNLYIADSWTIRKLTPATNQVTTVAGSISTGGLIDGAAASARLGSPGTLWGKDNLLYIEDTNHLVNIGDAHVLRTLDLTTDTVITVAPPGISGDGTGLNAEFNNPTGIWGDSDYLYVTDQGNHVLRRINRNTAEVQTVAGMPGIPGVLDGAGDKARFNMPSSVCSDGASVFIADSGNNAIRRVTLGTWQVSTFAGTLGKAGTPDTGLFNSPYGLWCDQEYLYVSDSGAVRRIRISTGAVQILLRPASGPLAQTSLWSDGRYLYFFSSAGLSKMDLSTLQVTNVAATASGNLWGDATGLYITGPYSIRRLDLTSGSISTIAGSDSTLGSEDGIGTAARFNQVAGIWSDGLTLYVTDQQNQAIRTIVLSTTPPAAAQLTFATSGGGIVSQKTTAGGSSFQYGYAHILLDTASAPVSGMAIYSLSVNDVLVSETAVPAVVPFLAGRLYAETSLNIRTGIAIENPNTQSVTVSFYSTDGSGQNFNSGSMTLNPNQQFAGFLDDPAFTGASPQPVSNARSFTFSASLPVAAIALRGHINERGDFLMTTLPIVDLAKLSSGENVIPHYVEGGGWTTEIDLLNPTDTTMTGSLQFLAQSGATLETQTYAIAPRSSTAIQRSAPGFGMRVGSIHVNPDPGEITPAGSVVFSFMTSGVTVTETGVPVVPAASTFIMYGENSTALRSGYAFANPSAQSVTLVYDVVSSDGIPTGISGTLGIPANGQRALFLDELPGAQDLPAGFKGILRASTVGGPVSAIDLRVRTNERGEVILSTTMPATEDTTATDLYIPHFVYGAGFTTEFILMSPTASTSSLLSGTMEFYSSTGQALPMAVR